LKDDVETLNEIRAEKNLEGFSFDLNSLDTETVQIREYMKIYLKDGSLICAPLGDVGD